MMEILKMLFMLMGAHALVDFSLQTDWIAKSKNRHHIPPGYDPDLHGAVQIIWPYVLSAHALQHGFAVYLITQDFTLGVAETAAHWIIDFLKCEKVYGIHTDQFLHFTCKVAWVWLRLL